MRKVLSNGEWLRIKPHKAMTPEDEENLLRIIRAFEAGDTIRILPPCGACPSCLEPCSPCTSDEESDDDEKKE